MARSFVPAPTPMSPAELEALRCSLRSDVAPTVDEGLRLLATIASVQTAMQMQASRFADFLAEGGGDADLIEWPALAGRRA